MTTKRIIACLDIKQGRVVKGKKFQNIEDVNDPIQLAKFYDKAGADELVFYDIAASNEQRNIFLDLVEKIAQEVNIPFVVGGGIRSIDDFSAVIAAGADKVSINSSAVQNPELIKQAALKFGSRYVIISMDIKKNPYGEYSVYINGGRVQTEKEAVSWAIEAEKLGAGELVINSIDTDGVRDGYDIQITRSIAEAVNIPVIASGGAGKKEDFLKILKEGKADAALAASVFHYGEISIISLKKYLLKNGLSIRG